MIVCVCNPVSDSLIRRAACEGGCGSFAEMAARLGVAQKCGRCADQARQVFEEALEQRREAAIPGG